MDIKYVIIFAVVFLIFILIGLAIVNYSGEDMYEKFKKFSVYPTGMSPVELANIVGEREFSGRIKIKYKDKLFCDSMASNYALTLCEKYANSYNISALSICAHELGHAYQFRDKLEKMYRHNRLNKISKIFSAMFTPLVLVGIIFLATEYQIYGYVILGFGIISLIIALISKFSTIGIEKEASNTGLQIMAVYTNLSDEELKMASIFLKSAKMTYVADLLRIMLKWTGLVKKRRKQ